jgi:putative FmdB family regulatory protein
MPVYEYECQACGHYLETLQKISEPPLTDCPVCGKPELKKLISAAGFRLKGGGWYETDFKNKDMPGIRAGIPRATPKRMPKPIAVPRLISRLPRPQLPKKTRAIAGSHVMFSGAWSRL